MMEEEELDSTQQYEQLISNITALSEEIEEHEDDDVDEDLLDNQLKNNLEIADRLYERANQPRELKLDSQHLLLCASIARRAAERVQTSGRSFNSVAFSEKLITLLRGERVRQEDGTFTGNIKMDDLQSLRLEHHSFLDVLPRVSPLCGFVAPLQAGDNSEEAKNTQGKKTISRKRDVIGEAIRMDARGSRDRGSEVSSISIVDHLVKKLRQRYRANGQRPINLFAFLTDPRSFENTCLHFFYMTFLARDMECKISYEDPEIPTVIPVDVKRSQDQSSRDARTLTMTYEKWENIVKTFNIQESEITCFR